MKVRVFVFPEDMNRFDAIVKKGIPTMKFTEMGSLSEHGEIQIITESERIIDFVLLGNLLTTFDYETARNLPPSPGQQRGKTKQTQSPRQDL